MMNNFDSAGKSMLPFHRKKMGNNVAKAEKKSLSFKCQVRNKFDNVGNSINNFYPLPFHRKILSNNVAKPEKKVASGQTDRLTTAPPLLQSFIFQVSRD